MQDLIKKLVENNISLSVINDDLKLSYGGEGVALDQEIIRQVKKNKSTLIDYLRKNADQQQYTPIPQAAPASDYPVSNGQRRLWILSQLEDGSRAYHLAGKLSLEGTFNAVFFERAIRKVMERHEILRTVFIENEQGELRQRVMPAAEVIFTVAYRDVEGMSQQALEAYLAENENLLFDLSRGPLFRAELVRLSAGHYIFHFCMHHIISDGISMEILSKEVLACYREYEKGGTPQLAPLAVQYKDYASWQQQELLSESYQAHRSYWRKQLSGTLPVLELPSDKTRPPVISNNGYVLVTGIGKHLTQRMGLLCKQQGSTLFMGLLAALKALFFRYTGQEDIIIGTPVAGRSHLDLQDQIGFYVNTLALRSRFSGTDSFLQLMGRVRDVTLQAYDHQVYPFDCLIDEVNPVRDMSRAAIFDVMLVLQNQQDSNARLSLPPGEIIAGGDCNLTAELHFSFAERADGLQLEVQFNKDIYSEDMAMRLIRHYHQLLKLLVQHPEMPIDQHIYLSTEEQLQLLETFQGKQVSYPSRHTLVDLFYEQAAQTPGHRALVFENEELTYKELDIRSNQLAHYLQTEGVGKETLVPVCMERSLEMIIGILGIMKAGGAYVPVDPRHPQDRIRYLLEDCKATVVVGSSRIQHKIPDGYTLVTMDGDREVLDSQPVSRPAEAPAPHQLAYVIYTSGSTGKPKGAMIEHQGMLNHLFAKINELKIDDTSILAATAPYTFDISVWQFFAALLCGGTTIIYPDDVILNPAELIRSVDEEGVTILELVPSYLTAVLQQEAGAPLKSLQYLLVTGEVVSRHILAAWFEHKDYGRIPVVNAYGPTEASDDITHHFMYETPAAVNVPLGRPVQNLQIYILDRGRQLCPVGVTGEICVAGIGVGRGYLNQPALTAEKFIGDPFCGNGGQRMYRTGDLGRWLPDGTLEYLGRIDSQVKIRGNRIELGEVEHALRSLKSITDAVVQPHKDANGQEFLVGYVVSKENQNSLSLRQQLQQVLPEYMVPGFFVQLEYLPLTDNSKVDRKSLPVPEEAYLGTGVEYTAPRNETETRLAEIWGEVLKTKEPIGVTQDFFSLGGHSLRITQLVNQYYRTFEVKLSVQDLFVHTTIAAQAALITGKVITAFHAISSIPAADDYAVSYGQRRLWVLSQLEGGSHAYHLPGVLHLEGVYEARYFEAAILKVIEHYEILRTVFRVNEAGDLRQVVLAPEAVAFSLAYKEMTDAGLEEIKAYLAADAATIFDLGKGPLLSAGLIRTGDRSYIFHYNMHHIISDAWSMEILKKKVMEAYQAYAQGAAPDWRPLPIQYRDYANWQQQETRETFSAHRSYWIKQLSGELPKLSLPAARVRPPVLTHKGYRLSAMLDEQLTRGIRELCQEKGCTLFMGMLAVLKALFYRYTGQDDIIIGSPVAGREHVDLEDQIGFYVNPLALRTRFSRQDSFLTLLNKVKETTMAGYEHQLYPFDKLAEDLQLKTDASRSLVFDVLLDLHNMDAEEEVTGFTSQTAAAITDLGPCAGKFDISLIVVEKRNVLFLAVEYNTDIYEKHTIVRFIEHFKSLLAAAIAGPRKNLLQLDYLSSAEKQQLLTTFNETAADTSGQTIMPLFAGQVTGSPDATALVFEQEEISYRQLDERSNQFARYLIRKGVGKGDLVPVCTYRSTETIISILGILKAGAAYVPVDPSCPAERVSWILSDIQARFIVTQTDLKELLEETTASCFKFYVDRDWMAIDMELPDAPEAAPAAGDLAYVIYTSGSTGNPKGVQIEHGSLRNYIDWVRAVYLNTAVKGHMGLYSPLSFDLTITTLFGTLTGGSRLYIYPQEQDITEILSHYLSPESGLDVIKLTPAHIAIIPYLGLDDTGVKNVIVGGEQLHSHHVATLKALHPDIKIFNEYGPTEATVGCTVAVIENTDEHITVGKPICNTTICILDSELNLVPVGVQGELCIGGIGLARGYLNREALTKEKFIAHPFEQGERLYRTGDIACWLPDGNIAYLGRVDDQVKINGYRIELGEVEHALNGLDAVEECAVAAHNGPDGQRYLAAYIVGKGAWNYTALRQQLLARIPEYMVPRYMVPLEKLPLTANGKVDRKALPDPEQADTAGSTAYIAPRTEGEAILAELYARFFDKEHISVKDSFFELGGNSMIAVSLSGKLKQLGYATTVNEILKYPVLEDLALALRLTATDEDSLSTPEQKVSVPASLTLHPLSYNQQVYCSKKGIIHSTGTVSFRLKDFEKSRFLEAYDRVAADFDILRIKFHKQQDGIFQTFLPSSAAQNTIRFIYHPQLDINDENVISQQQAITKDEFDLYNGEIMRCGVLHNESEAHVFLVIHHIATDLYTNHLVRDRFVAYYYEKELPPVTGRYSDYINEQQRYLLSEAAKPKVGFWEAHLQSTGEKYSGRVASDDRAGKESVLVVNRQVIAGNRFLDIVRRCRKEGIFSSVFMLSAYSQFLAEEEPEQQQWLMQVVVNGRDGHIPGFPVDKLPGQLVNSLPLILENTRPASSAELFKQVQQRYLDGRTNQEIHIEYIRQWFMQKYAIDLTTVSDGSFNYLNYSHMNFEDPIASSASLERSIHQHTGKLFVKCAEYKNALLLEWKIRRSEEEAHTLLRSERDQHRLSKIINSLLQ